MQTGFKHFILTNYIFLLLLLYIKADSVDFHSTSLDSPPEDLIWCGPAQDVIFILTEKSSVYKSLDKGFSWTNLNDLITSAAQESQENKNDKLGKVSRMLQSPVDKSLLIFLGTEGFSWVVQNCGRSIKALFQGRPISEFIFHPTERNWGLASAFSLCEDYVNEPCKIVKELFVTQTLGEDWKILGDYIHTFSWGVKDENMIKAGIPKERIILTYQPRGRGNQQFEKKWSYKVDLVYSDDFFETKVVGVRKGNRFLLTSKYLYVSQVLDQETQEVQLLHAKSTDKKYEFSPIVTNQQSFKEHSYSFLDTTEDMVFLYINNFGQNAKYGNVYASGDQGKMFSLSLKNNIQLYDYDSDFENIRSTEGVYLANVISGKYMKLARQEIENENRGANIGNEKKTAINHRNYVKTLITHNKGGDWKRLKAPAVDSKGDSYNCGDYCYLHLHSYSSEIPQFYSVDSAVGIIIGNGNVGRYLDYGYNDMALFISRDGGLNWFEIRKGVYIYEIGDHGGLIVAAKFDQPTTSVLYTYDEGMTWETLNISDEQIQVKNILIEPTSSSQHFLVYGVKKSSEGESIGIVINLNFASLHMPTCGRNDYEIWSPRSSKEGHECLLGRKVSYSRRKRDSKCLNGEGFERKVIVESCPCTDDDYQCDIGYHRMEPGDPCTPIKPIDPAEANKPPEVCNGYYTISRGYRKIAGNYCKGGAKYEPILVACPYNKIWYAIKLGLYALIGFAILGIILMAVNSKNDLLEIFSGLGESLKAFRTFNKPTENYLNIDNVDEDNTLFENEDNEVKPVKKEENEEKKKDGAEEKNEDGKLINEEHEDESHVTK